MMSARPPNAPNDMPPPIYFPSVVRSGLMPRTCCSPPGDRRDVITSSRISSAPTCVVASRSIARNSGAAAMQPPPPIIGSRITSARSAACCSISALRRRHVVVRRQHVVERRVDRRAAAGEAEHRAVVAAVEHHHLRPPGEDAADRDRQQVRFGAGVGEPHPLQPEALAHGAGELRLGQVGAAEVDAGVQRAIHRGTDHRMRMAVDAGGVFAEEVDVLGAVEVPQPAALAACDAEREGRIVQHGARVAARHDGGRLDEAGEALGIARRHTLPSPR